MEKRPFKDWKITRFKAESPDEKYTFWIASGFYFFRDIGKEQLLSLLPFLKKYRVWREVRKEMVSRASDLLNNL